MNKNNIVLGLISVLGLFLIFIFSPSVGGCGKAIPEASTTTTATGAATTTTTTSTSSTTTTTYSGWTVITGTKMGTAEILVRSDFSSSTNRATPGLGSGIAGEFGVSFLTSDEGWTVGNAGDILRTKNGTTATPTAEFINCGSGGRLQDVVVYTSDQVWISGRDTSGSSIFYTANGGTNWTVQTNTADLYPGRSLYSLDRLNTLSFVVEGGNIYGWAGGGLGDNSSLIVKTTNGVSWEESYHSAIPAGGTINQFFGIYFIDKNVGMAVGYNGEILKTTNGGGSWESQSSGTTKALYEIRMKSSTEAIAAGEGGVILRTTNGGGAWSSIGLGATTDLYALEVRENNLWVGGAGGKIYASTNNGAAWAEQTSNTNKSVQAITMLTDTYGWAVCGETSSNQGSILKTTTGGN